MIGHKTALASMRYDGNSVKIEITKQQFEEEQSGRVDDIGKKQVSASQNFDQGTIENTVLRSNAFTEVDLIATSITGRGKLKYLSEWNVGKVGHNFTTKKSNKISQCSAESGERFLALQCNLSHIDCSEFYEK